MKFSVKTRDFTYPIVVEQGALERLDGVCDLERRVLVVTDDGVPEAYAERVAAQCREPVVVRLPQGEATKTLESWARLLQTLLDHHFDRKDCVVAVGGGVMGDLAGFAAASYMRGVDFYNVPTTLLSQVDSSIGGKTAVDFGGVKNSVGAFYPPRAVVIDPQTLKTLDARQVACGMAETIKMAAAFDADFFTAIEAGLSADDAEALIAGALRIKRAVVEADETEKGLRRALNFGHTVGHAIEANSALLHGESIAAGMLYFASGEARERIAALLRREKLPTETDVAPKRLMETLLHDKKAEADGVVVVRVDEIGTHRLEKLSQEALWDVLTQHASKGGRS
ncbi:MAG: 3-dehydroquinate synthase [Peptoniphilaceae bacterium]|nr:3-dehydroquinate synthase [Peptoniphilaceae bacterium]MDY6086293.1 3-dehydroquinate synthase [Peptoniphilaceae bacterium]